MSAYTGGWDGQCWWQGQCYKVSQERWGVHIIKQGIHKRVYATKRGREKRCQDQYVITLTWSEKCPAKFKMDKKNLTYLNTTSSRDCSRLSSPMPCLAKNEQGYLKPCSFSPCWFQIEISWKKCSCRRFEAGPLSFSCAPPPHHTDVGDVPRMRETAGMHTGKKSPGHAVLRHAAVESHRHSVHALETVKRWGWQKARGSLSSNILKGISSPCQARRH